MKKGRVLFGLFAVLMFFHGTNAWSVDPTQLQAPTLQPKLLSPAPTTTTTQTYTSSLATLQQGTLLQQKVFSGYKFDTVGTAYFNEMLSGNVYPGSSTVLLTGTFTNTNVSATSPPEFHDLGYKESICVPLVGCTDHKYGATVSWNFNVKGPVTYTYSVPSTIDFVFPQAVFPGQRIYLAPTFRWPAAANPTINTTMNYAYSHDTEFWADAPFDGMDALTLGFWQYNNYARISTGIPVFPGFNSLNNAWNFDFWPFSSGGGNYPPDTNANFIKLGGTGSLTNTYITRFVNPTPTLILVDVGETSDVAWKAGHEQFDLTAAVVNHIVPPAGTIVAGAKWAGDFELITQLEGRIKRDDTIQIVLAGEPYVDVPLSPLEFGADNTWSFNKEVTLRYWVAHYSCFTYKLPALSLTFDMRWIDKKNLWTTPSVDWNAGCVGSEVQWRTSVFKVSGKVPVRPRVVYPAGLAYDASHPLVYTMQTQMPIKLAGATLATPQQKPTVIRASRTMSFPIPTALRGEPKSGEYTVVLGAAAAVKANEIVALLKSKGISAYTIKSGGTTELVITLGVFLDRAQAELLARMVKEIFKIDSDIVQKLTQVKFRPLGDDVVQRLKMPL